MLKIASPQELQAEIRAIMAFVHASEKPDRQVVASKLRELADRVAAVKKEKIPESEQDSWKDSVRRNKGKYHGPNGLKSGQKYKHQGKDWLIMDFDADSKAPGGSTLVLVSPDFKETIRGVEVAGAKKTAGAPSKGQKDKVKYHGVDDATFKVLRVFPTKDDADGPLPRDLLRLIKKGGGAALVELLPSGDYKVKGDMLVSPGSSKPRHYIRAFGSSGSWDGFPVALKPAQLKRLHSYREAVYREAVARAAARKPKVKLPKSIDPPSYTLKELEKAGLNTAVMSLSSPSQYMYKLNEKLRGNYGVSVPLPGSYQGEASVQIDPKGLTGDSGDAEVALVAYAIANGTSTNIPLKKLKLYVWWEKRDKGYNIVLKVDTSKPNMDAEKKRLQDY